MNKHNTYIFCDETKFYLNNNDSEESIYYLGIAIEKNQYLKLKDRLKEILENRRIKAKTLHSTSIFRKKRPRIELMEDLTNLIIDNNLKCFCHKYEKNELFEKAKLLGKFNSSIINFNKVEFQALFFFMTNLNTYIRDFKPNLLEKEIGMFFDRNVYGVNETESFVFPNDNFIISDMTFCEKSEIDLLFLPDFIGFILKKTIENTNSENVGNEVNENANKNYIKLKSSGNLNFVNIKNEIIEKTINKLK
ncbi:hypothetical protein PG913_08040 [Tenacibaculum pacificus]|uniref:hypothetical protein n=1 Tax=Tenacibaculum pacificus TaxID=3018314 RepID=UPI0022F397C4|nr:hypothetical protein [Tenacibaculum pacificus]WBX72854.1 hypothetical protein PG913_08040 [Tenacibaculum pacificus]